MEDEGPRSSALVLAIKDAVGRLLQRGGDASPSVIGSVAAGIAAAFEGQASHPEPVQGVRFVTPTSPIRQLPHLTLPPLYLVIAGRDEAGEAIGGREPAAPQGQ
jgi:hypothetical protein